MQDIAIIGIGCLFPGADNPERFWQNLWENKDFTSLISEKEIGKDPMDYFDPVPATPDKICYRKNGYIRDFKFDPTGYRIDPDQLMPLDNLFLWTLYAAKEAVKDSGYLDNETALKRCGIISGSLSFPTRYSKQLFSSLYMNVMEPHVQALLNNRQFRFHMENNASALSPYNALTASFPTTVTAKALGVQGPSYAIDAACSSALYCMKFASYYLNAGKADIMLAGAACRPDHILVSHGFNMLQASPPDNGRSIPMDRSSQGLSLGEGAGFFVLKRYEDAVHDGDHIYAIIENIGLSNDGGAQHILMPDKNGQLLALERAYENRSKRVDYIECHATGTPLGDRMELDTLESFFQDTDLPLFGANKAGIGHMLTASGMAGMIKVVLSMVKGEIPATIGIEHLVETKNKKIKLNHMAFQNSLWQKKGDRKRAGINAFGFGGTNAHMILKEHIINGQSDKNTVSVSTNPQEKSFPRKNEVSGKQRIRSKIPISRIEKQPRPLAIVGMGMRFGDVDGIKAFTHAVQNDTLHFTPLSSHRWLGIESNPDYLKAYGFETGQAPECAYFNQGDIDCIKLKLPPKMVDLPLANHLFMAEIAIKAIIDAGLNTYNRHDRSKILTPAATENEFSGNYKPKPDIQINKGDATAVIIAWEMDPAMHRSLTRCEIPQQLRKSLEQCQIKLDPNKILILENILKESLFPEPYLEGITGGIGNLAASRIASTLGFRGPCFTIASQENSIFKAMELAKFLFAYESIDTVLVGGLDMAAGWESVLWRNNLYRQRDNNNKISRLNFGEGGGAVVLKRYEDAKKEGYRIYSVIRSLAVHQQHPSGDVVCTPSAECVCETCKDALSKAGLKPSDIQYLELHQSGIPDEDEAESEGIAKAYCCDDSAADTAMGSIKKNIGHTFSASGIAGIIKNAISLYHGLIPQSRRKGKKRFSAINSLGGDGSCSHLILSEPEKDDWANAEQFELKRNAYGNGKKRKSFMKTLLNGGPALKEMILEKEHIKKFQMDNVIPFVVLSTATAAASDRKLPFIVLSTADNTLHKARVPAPKAVIWEESDLIEMTDGLLSNVLGPAYKKADTYPVRTRMPSPPFMFATRVTKMTARKGKLKPCVIEWEYDIPKDAWYAVNGDIPMIIPFEASHTLILALSYIGCDEMFDGKARYRALDSTVVILDHMPVPGDTLIGEVNILSFIMLKSNLLISYEFNAYIKEKKIFTITANAGLFSSAAMEKSKGLSPVYKFDPTLKNEHFVPLLDCRKKRFDLSDIRNFQDGNFQDCFGSDYRNQHPCPLGVKEFLMLDRIASIESDAGMYGLGIITGEKDIDPDHWIFKAHFKNDPVIPGTMIILGVYQTLLFYVYYLGLHTQFSSCKPSFVANRTSTVKFRGEVRQNAATISYRLLIKKIHSSRDSYIIADAEVIHHDKIIGICEDLGFILVPT